MAIGEFIAVTKALADEHRVRMLAALQAGELCVCQLIALLGLAPSTVSKHLTILKHAKLIEARKDGRWVHYRLADAEAPQVAHDAILWVREALSKEKQVMQDAKRLKAILRMNPEILCCRWREATQA